MRVFIIALLAAISYAQTEKRVGCSTDTVQAEDGQLVDFPLGRNPKGYEGEAFIDAQSQQSSATITVSTQAGPGSVTIRYASKKRGRKMVLAVDGSDVETIAFPATGSWGNWDTVNIPVTWSSNGRSTVTLKGAPGAAGPNVDSFTIESGCSEPPAPVLCSSDVLNCQDGSTVSRDPSLNCEFPECPITITPAPVLCSSDFLICQDGTTLRRDPALNCEYPECKTHPIITPAPVLCSSDVLNCQDGSIVRRDPSRNCEFPECPPNITPAPVLCSSDVLHCQDGSTVSRDPSLNCEFPECPTVDFCSLCRRDLGAIGCEEETCRCAPGFDGTFCEISVLTFCDDEPCLNNGFCDDFGDGPQCHCIDGFTGMFCENAPDFCANNPCLNGALCSNAAGGAACRCIGGFTGDRCQNAPDFCGIQNPCLNGGVCENTLTGTSCFCPSGFTGEECEISDQPDFSGVHAAIRTAFREVQQRDDQMRKQMPALIRKSFHDAGHFDKTTGQVETRMGCIQHFLEGTQRCVQHGGFEDAVDFINRVIRKIEAQGFTAPSHADMVQLLGALAVDTMSSGFPSLYDRIRMGRIDTDESICRAVSNPRSEDHMCTLLPNFHGSVKHGDSPVHLAVQSAWDEEIQGKMLDRNGMTVEDAVSLIGAHTVGHHHGFGAWVEDPMVFNNNYFRALQEVANERGRGSVFRWLPNQLNPTLPANQRMRYNRKLFPDWFQDDMRLRGEDSRFFKKFDEGEIMMLDADIALIQNAPQLVDRYANSEAAWRADFDAAFIKMGEFGVITPLFSINSAAAEQAVGMKKSLTDFDEDASAEFFQNLQIAKEDSVSKIQEFHKQSHLQAEALGSQTDISKFFNFVVRVFALLGLASIMYGIGLTISKRRSSYTAIEDVEV